MRTWDSSISSITLSVLLISILLAFHRHEKPNGHSGSDSLCSAGYTWGCLWSRQSNPGYSRPRRCVISIPRCPGRRPTDSHTSITTTTAIRTFTSSTTRDRTPSSQQGERNVRGHDSGSWIEHGIFHLQLSKIIADGIERHYRALREDRSLAPRHRRRIFGRSALQAPPHEEPTGDFSIGSSDSLDLERFGSLSH